MAKQDSKQTAKGCGLFIVIAVIISIAIAFCGDEDDKAVQPEPVTQSQLDGSVRQVNEYLKQNLNDPASYESIEWSPMVEDSLNTKARYTVRHKFRVKNELGGYMIHNMFFYLDSTGIIIDVKE